MCLRRDVLSVEPLIYKDFSVQVSPSLSDGVMEKSWENEVQARSQLSSIPNFPITMEISMRLLEDPTREARKSQWLDTATSLKPLTWNYRLFFKLYSSRSPFT